MTTATQGEVRSWARSQGVTVNSRGSLPVSVTEAYAAAHPRSPEATTKSGPASTTTARRSAPPKPARAKLRAVGSKTATSTPARRAASTRTRAVRAPDSDPLLEATAPVAGSTDLAGGLRSYLDSIDGEVRAVSVLSERIDGLVTELNDLRDQQAKRLIALDELRTSVTDKTLGSFLDQAIKPRKTRVSELIPERLL